MKRGVGGRFKGRPRRLWGGGSIVSGVVNQSWALFGRIRKPCAIPIDPLINSELLTWLALDSGKESPRKCRRVCKLRCKVRSVSSEAAVWSSGRVCPR
ncbi:hypothetical protein ABZP36_026471 [Zizania latifolia]